QRVCVNGEESATSGLVLHRTQVLESHGDAKIDKIPTLVIHYVRILVDSHDHLVASDSALQGTSDGHVGRTVRNIDSTSPKLRIWLLAHGRFHLRERVDHVLLCQQGRNINS